MKLDELKEAADPIAKTIKSLPVKWSQVKEKNENIFITIIGDQAFQIYYDPTDTIAIGWAEGHVAPRTKKISWDSSGTDDVKETVSIFKKWLKHVRTSMSIDEYRRFVKESASSPKIKTLDQFIKKAKELDAEGRIDDMYDVFEFDTTDEVRDQVYNHADRETPEPFRSAMWNLGFKDY